MNPAFALGMKTVTAAGNTAEFDSRFQNGSGATTSPFAFLSNAGAETGTVGAISSTNLRLIAFLAISEGKTAVAVSWDAAGTPQSMTQVGTTQTLTGIADLYAFDLVAPHTGNLSLSVSWSGGSAQIILGAIAFYNCAQSVTATLYTNSGTGLSETLDVTSANKHVAAHFFADANASTGVVSAGTQVFNERSYNGNFIAIYRKSTTTPTTGTAVLGTSVAWKGIGVDLINL